jgi:hypothetical protein
VDFGKKELGKGLPRSGLLVIPTYVHFWKALYVNAQEYRHVRFRKELSREVGRLKG